MIYKIWKMLGEKFGYSGKYFRELDTHKNRIISELSPEFEKVIRKYKNGS